MSKPADSGAGQSSVQQQLPQTSTFTETAVQVRPTLTGTMTAVDDGKQATSTPVAMAARTIYIPREVDKVEALVIPESLADTIDSVLSIESVSQISESGVEYLKNFLPPQSSSADDFDSCIKCLFNEKDYFFGVNPIHKFVEDVKNDRLTREQMMLDNTEAAARQGMRILATRRRSLRKLKSLIVHKQNLRNLLEYSPDPFATLRLFNTKLSRKDSARSDRLEKIMQKAEQRITKTFAEVEGRDAHGRDAAGSSMSERSETHASLLEDMEKGPWLSKTLKTYRRNRRRFPDHPSMSFDSIALEDIVKRAGMESFAAKCGVVNENSNP